MKRLHRRDQFLRVFQRVQDEGRIVSEISEGEREGEFLCHELHKKAMKAYDLLNKHFPTLTGRVFGQYHEREYCVEDLPGWQKKYRE